MFELLPDSKAVKFVIVFRGRSGSTLLITMLDSHPEVCCHSELFNAEGSCLSKGSAGAPNCGVDKSVAYRDRHPISFLRNIYKQEGVSAIGFKIGAGHNKLALLVLLLSRDVKKVILERENLLGAYSSLLLAKRSGVWSKDNQREFRDKRNEGGAKQIVVNPKDFKGYVYSTKAFFSAVKIVLRLTGQRWFEVDYKKLNEELTITNLLDYLQVDSRVRLVGGVRKQNPSCLEQRIANYEELCARWRNSRFASYLVE